MNLATGSMQPVPLGPKVAILRPKTGVSVVLLVGAPKSKTARLPPGSAASEAELVCTLQLLDPPPHIPTVSPLLSE